jgi:hypothetical protein
MSIVSPIGDYKFSKGRNYVFTYPCAALGAGFPEHSRYTETVTLPDIIRVEFV